MTPPLACRLKLFETASPPEVRLTGDTGLDLEVAVFRGLMSEGVRGVFASDRERCREGVFG